MKFPARFLVAFTHPLLVSASFGQPFVQENDEIVVTAPKPHEPPSPFPGAIYEFDASELNLSAPRQLTDFFHQKQLAQVQEFGPGHANVFLRGSTTGGAGQSWADASEIGVLINGRPSGTANLGKLSMYDIERIEVLQGPNSVLYGTSGLGGVINLVTKNGRTAEGTTFTTLFSSQDRYTQVFETSGKKGGFDYYFELNHTTADDYRSGGGHLQRNTSYEQRGATLALGYQIDPLQRLDFTFRQDGMYDAGHPGLDYSLTSYDNRYGTSLDLTYTGETQDGKIRWKNQAYWVRDVDKFHWSQDPFRGLIAALINPLLIGTPGIERDFNNRRQVEWGNRLSFDLSLAEKNTLTVGLDLKTSDLTNRRERDAAPGYLGGLVGIPVDLPPLGIDTHNSSAGLFLWDRQTLFDDKLTLTAGARYERFRQEALRTPGSLSEPHNRNDDYFVWQAGASWKANPWLTLKGNVGTGYLASSPGFRYAVTRQTNGFGILGNPDLKDEKSFGWDLGATVDYNSLNLGVTFFEQTTYDYVTTYLIPGTTTLQPRNADEKRIRGTEATVSYDLAPALKIENFVLSPYARGNYYFSKRSVDLAGRSADQALLTDWALNAGIRAGRPGKWSMDLFVTSAGPAEVNAGITQNANVGLADIADNGTIPGYTILNFRADWRINENLTVFGGVNNILDKNYSPYFIPLNDGRTGDVGGWMLPGIASGDGFSAPGREFFGGLSWRF